MKTDRTTVEKMAHLARLQLDPAEVESIQKSMEQILSWMEKLNELGLENVEPLVHMSTEINVLREDKHQKHISREDALKNAPKHDDQYFRVPKVIEQN